MDETRVITVNTGTTAQWNNQVRPLEVGEFGYDSITGELKIGDGATAWAQLPSRTGAVELSRSAFDALLVKNPSTFYLVKSGGGHRTFLGANSIDNTPVATIIYTTRATAPAGYLKANGAAISRTVYADLFSAIGTTYGAGDGVTTFNLPDLRGEFLRGWDDGRGVDGGRALGSWQGDALGLHNHPQGGSAVSNGDHTHAQGGQAASVGDHNHQQGGSAASNGAHTHTVSGTAASAGAHTHTMNLRSRSGTAAAVADGGPNVSYNNVSVMNSAGAHTHSLTGASAASAGAHTHSLSGNTQNGGAHAHNLTGNTANNGAHTHNLTGNTGNAGSGDTRPRNRALATYIKY